MDFTLHFNFFNFHPLLMSGVFILHKVTALCVVGRRVQKSENGGEEKYGRGDERKKRTVPSSGPSPAPPVQSEASAAELRTSTATFTDISVKPTFFNT